VTHGVNLIERRRGRRNETLLELVFSLILCVCALENNEGLFVTRAKTIKY